MRVRKDDVKTFVFPETGIYVHSSAGFHLFHHRTLHSVKPIHEDRLAEYGILINRTNFKPEEDARIYKNWRTVCDRYGLDYGSPSYYLGWNMKNRGNRAHLNDLKGIPFYPTLCHGLTDRFAKQVYSRMVFLFDPTAWDPEKGRDLEKYNCNFTPELDAELCRLYKLYRGDWSQVSKDMELPVITLTKRYMKLRYLRQKRKTPLKQNQWKRLWNIVRSVEGWLAFSDKRLVKKIVVKGKISPTKWDQITKRMNYVEERVVEAWDSMIFALREAIDSGKAPLNALKELVFDKAVPLKNLEFGVYISILRKHVPKNTRVFRGLRKRESFDFFAVDEKRIIAGITGFYTHPSRDEANYIFHRCTQVVQQYREKLFSRLSLDFSLRDILSIIQRSCTAYPEHTNIPTNIAVTEMVRYIVKKMDSTFVIPYIFRKYVIDSSLLQYFCVGDNSQLLKAEDKLKRLQLVLESDISDVEELWTSQLGNTADSEEIEKIQLAFALKRQERKRCRKNPYDTDSDAELEKRKRTV